MEFMEIIIPGDFATTEITPPAAVAPDRNIRDLKAL
jgi:hypothetical protein